MHLSKMSISADEVTSVYGYVCIYVYMSICVFVHVCDIIFVK